MTFEESSASSPDNPIEPVSGPAERNDLPEPEVRELRRHEIGDAVAVLARGMRDNPLHVAAYGLDPDQRLARHARLMRGVFRVFTSLQPLCVVRDGHLLAVTGVAPAGTCQPRVMQRISFLPNIVASGLASAMRVLRWTSTWSAHDPDYPHVHLGPLAVDAEFQRQGIGSLLMREHCRRLDRSLEIGYLETDKAENVRFYERFGYHVTGDARVLGVPNWFMRRDPAAHTTRHGRDST